MAARPPPTRNVQGSLGALKVFSSGHMGGDAPHFFKRSLGASILIQGSPPFSLRRNALVLLCDLFVKVQLIHQNFDYFILSLFGAL